MNPEGAEWLEALPEDVHRQLFIPVLKTALFELKRDHEGCSPRSGACWECRSLDASGIDLGPVVIE